MSFETLPEERVVISWLGAEWGDSLAPYQRAFSFENFENWRLIK